MTTAQLNHRPAESELAMPCAPAKAPELLARLEELTDLSTTLRACDDCCPEIFERIRLYVRSLDTLDMYGLLIGPVRARYVEAVRATGL